MRAGIWLGLTCWSALAALGAGQTLSRSERGEQILGQACTRCHDHRVIQVQALDKNAWTEVVDSMVAMGATIAADDKPILIDYLVERHGPLPDGPGKEILLNTCTMCHDLSRVKSHTGTRDQWEETLISMLNEGAPLSDEEFPVILNYLARNFRPR